MKNPSLSDLIERTIIQKFRIKNCCVERETSTFINIDSPFLFRYSTVYHNIKRYFAGGIKCNGFDSLIELFQFFPASH